MSPEPETLDQLLGGSLPLSVVRTFYQSDDRFIQSVVALLENGDVKLLDVQQRELPRWRWREFAADWRAFLDARLDLTEAGAKRIV